jgi:hypothetical protein
MQLDDAVGYALAAGVTAVGGAVSAIVAALWMAQRDLVKRIRCLEQARLEEARAYSTALYDLATKVTTALSNVTATLREMVVVQRSRPCMADLPQPQNLPEIQTNAITAKIRDHA